MKPATPLPAAPGGPALVSSRPASRALAALAGVALLASGCGTSAAGGGHASTAASVPPGAASRPAAYTRCMRAHGEPSFPSPVDGRIVLHAGPGSALDPSSPRYQAAARACAAWAPQGSPAAGGAGTATGGAGASTGTPVTASQIRAFGSWLGQRARAGQFSGTALIARGSRILLDAGYGLADRQAGVRNTAQTRFCVASIGKLFTAVAVAQLVQQRKLSFDAAVGRYLTGFPAAIADHVTVADLLDMTSGLGNAALGGAHPPATLAGMLTLVERERLQFRPGSRFDYSNDGYLVLGAVIQAVTGQSYASYLRGHVLGPAGMTHTGLGSYTPARVTGMAHGYALTGQPPAAHDNSSTPQLASPAGGAWSTAGDLLGFARALLGHRLLSPAMTATVLTPRVNSPQPGGPPVDKYSYGFAYQAINGVTFVGHNGGTPGYEGQLDIYPATGYVAIILTNTDQVLVPAIQRSEALLTSA